MKVLRAITLGVIGLLGSWQGVAFAKPADAALSDLLKKRTQELSDAGQNGDRAVLDRYLDTDVVYTVEDGSVATKADILASADGKPKSGRTITVTEWSLRVQGDVATALFVDEVKVNLFGQSLDFKFRSTETWLKKTGDWKMISSHTMALLEDPAAVTLTTQQLQDYVGRYRAGEGANAGPEVNVAIKDGNLVATPAGDSPVDWKAEAPDVFFTPGQPRVRKVFQRDASGHITGYSSRREGRDLILKKVG